MLALFFLFTVLLQAVEDERVRFEAKYPLQMLVPGDIFDSADFTFSMRSHDVMLQIAFGISSIREALVSVRVQALALSADSAVQQDPVPLQQPVGQCEMPPPVMYHAPPNASFYAWSNEGVPIGGLPMYYPMPWEPPFFARREMPPPFGGQGFTYGPPPFSHYPPRFA